MHFIIIIYNYKCTLLSRCKLHIFVLLSQSPAGVHQFAKKYYQEDKCGIRNSHCFFSLVIIVHFHLDASFISLSQFPKAQLGCNQSAVVEKGCVQKKSLYDRIAILLPPSLFNDRTNCFCLKFELVVYMSKSLVLRADSILQKVIY